MKLGIGPVIEDGFYYDIDMEQSLTPEDLAKIEKEMEQDRQGKSADYAAASSAAKKRLRSSRSSTIRSSWS